MLRTLRQKALGEESYKGNEYGIELKENTGAYTLSCRTNKWTKHKA